METIDKLICHYAIDENNPNRLNRISSPAMTDLSSTSSTISSDYGSWITAPSETDGHNKENCLPLSVRFNIDKKEKENVKSLYEPIFNLVDENSDLILFEDSKDSNCPIWKKHKGRNDYLKGLVTDNERCSKRKSSLNSRQENDNNHYNEFCCCNDLDEKDIDIDNDGDDNDDDDDDDIDSDKDMSSVNISSLALMVFLKENYNCNGKEESVKKVKDCLKKTPWILHHTESTTRGSIHPYPFNNLDYYSCSSNLPLLALRQVHYGKEIIRIVRFVSHKNWQDQINFYSLIIAQNATIIRNDFCLFVLRSKNSKFQLHFALKKAPDKVKISKVNGCFVQFSIDKIGHLVPLLPKTANQISENLWLSNDLDGNQILFSTVKGSNWSSRVSLSHVSVSELSSKELTTKKSRNERDKLNDDEEENEWITDEYFDTFSVISKTQSDISMTKSELSTLCHHIEPKQPIKLTKTLVKSIRDSRQQLKRIREGDSGVDSPKVAPSTARSLTPCSATSSKYSDKLSPRVFLNGPSQKKLVEGLKGFYV